MQSITALILSLILMFSAVGYSGTAAPASGTQKPAVQAEAVAEATVAANSFVRSIPSTLGKIVASPKANTKVGILRSTSMLGTEWSCIRIGDVTGWIPTAELKMPVVKPVEEPIPYWAKWGIVNTRDLNIRTAPGVNNEKVGTYHFGDRVAILETNCDWGRTTRGWVYLGYIYLDGTLGDHPMSGIVTASQLNVRKGPSTGYSVVKHLYYGAKVEILEQFQFNSTIWGCTKDGWVCMDYVVPEHVEPPVIATGIVTSDGLLIYSTREPYPVIGALKEGDVVSLYAIEEHGGVRWGLIPEGWILMDGVDIGGEKPTVPEETTPDETDPDETDPDETDPDETDPDKTDPDETDPDKTDPDKTDPDETDPDETDPDETDSDKTDPDEAETSTDGEGKTE